MLNILYFLLLLLHSLNTIPGFIIFSITVFFFWLLYRRFKKNSKSTVVSLIQITCYSIPLSWINILGGEYSELPISWFYIFLMFLTLYLILIKKDAKVHIKMMGLVVIIFVILIFSFIPLIITPTSFLKQGVSQFIILMFHHIVIAATLFKGNILNKEQLLSIQKSYVVVGFISALGIITQFILYKNGTVIGSIDFYLNRESFRFLFSDVSHASLYLTTCSFLAFLLLNSNVKKANYIFMIFIMLVASAVTSARTGLVVFFIIFIMYIFIKQRGVVKKMLSLILGLLFGYLTIAFMQIVRPQQSLTTAFLDSSGRDSGYEMALALFFEKPFLGHGFSIGYISQIMDQPIPHLSFLQYMVHGGIFYAILTFGVVITTMFYAKRLRLHESWLIFITLVGTCLIPDIFSTRYITLLIVIVFLVNPTPKETKNPA